MHTGLATANTVAAAAGLIMPPTIEAGTDRFPQRPGRPSAFLGTDNTSLFSDNTCDNNTSLIDVEIGDGIPD